ncbi:MAG: HAMP domain-containing histidine kinase [Campylobacterales bacterium]|nr:HAMP domain-containing histidine kinase [Campylobacterales bacterium]
MSVSSLLIALFLSSFVISDHKRSLEHSILAKMHLIAKDIVEHGLYLSDVDSLKDIYNLHESYHSPEYLESMQHIKFAYHISKPIPSNNLEVIEKLPNGKYLLVWSDRRYINENINALLLELFFALIGILSLIMAVFYFFLRKLLYPLKCLVNYCNSKVKSKDSLPICSGSYEANALKEAILSLEQRNQVLCKEKQNIFKEAAHEIKTPIAILKARIDLFAKSNMEKEKFINESKSDIATISNKLRELIFLKAIEWDIQQAKERVMMQNQCSMMQQLFKPILEKKNIKMVSNLQEDFALFIHKEAIGRVMQAIFENIFMNTKNGTTIQTYVDAHNSRLKIVNEVDKKSDEILFSSHIGTKLIKRLADELEYSYETYEEGKYFYTEITFKAQ